MATKALRGLPTLLVGLLTVAVMFTAYTATQADASHEPANKIAAAGSGVDAIEDDDVVLSETLKVATTHDLMLSLSAECSILTSLLTGEEAPAPAIESTDDAFAFGSVRLRLEIDGQPVPVSTDDFTDESGDDQADDDDEVGEVTFCNRAYQRTVTDSERGNDGLDTIDDFIKTRTATAFNWIALNVGVDDPDETGDAADANDGYDNVVLNGNNIVLIEVIADYDVDPAACGQQEEPDNASDPLGMTCADAFVGSRTLIAEPTNASIHELVEPQDPEGGS